MNTNSLSVNSLESLAKNHGFDKYFLPIETKDLSKEDCIAIRDCINNGLYLIKRKRQDFIFTTKLQTASRSYKYNILQFKIRTEQLTDNLMKINRQLKVFKEGQKQEEYLRKEKERDYLYFFWKVSREVLKTSDFKKISEETQNYCPFPESIIR